MATALITGVTGQDGGYLAAILSARGDQVVGMVHSLDDPLLPTLRKRLPKISIEVGDLGDARSLDRVLTAVQPNQIYNLAALTFVGQSFIEPERVSDITGMGVVRLLEAMRQKVPTSRLVHASSSEMFGDAGEWATEETPLNPVSPYGAAKAFAHMMVGIYRRSHSLHTSTVILFNHESPRRPPTFVTRKITQGAARIAQGLDKELRLGNLDSSRDWGSAQDYMRALPLAAAHDTPSDWVIASGETHTVRELCDIAFTRVGLDYHDYVVVDPQYFRPTEPQITRGLAKAALDQLGWTPTVSFVDLIHSMVDEDVALLDAARNDVATRPA